MQQQIIKGFDYFLKQNELGKTDSKNINRLLQMMDENGHIDKQTILEQIFVTAADADANYRNFIKRTLDAIARLIEDSEANSEAEKILKSIEINALKANKIRKAQLQLKVGYSSANIQPLANRQYEDENFEPNIAKDTHKPIDENAIRVFISYSKDNKSDAQYFRQLFEKRKPVIDGKEVVIWTMNQLIAGSSFDEQIQENLNKSDFGFGALSQQFLQSEYITTQEIPHFLQQKSLFLFGLDKRIDGNTLSVDDFFSKVNKKLNKDNTKILQEQVCYLDDGSGDFFVDCSTPERKNAFVDKVIKGLEAMYNNKPKDSLPQTQKTDKISPSLDKRYLEEYHQPSSAKLTQMSTESEALSTTNIKTATNIEVNLITDMLDWIKNSPQSIYALLGDYGMGKTFSCRILSAKLTEEEGAIKPFYIDLRDTPTFITEKDIVRQPYLEEIIQSVLRRQEVTTDAQTFIQQAQSGNLIFIFDGLDEKLVHYTKDMRQQFLTELMRVFPNTVHLGDSKVKIILSCRSHHFEDLKAQSSFFRGLGRDNSAQQDYRAMEILPFNSTQIQSMLKKQLGEQDSALVFKFISDNHYLSGLASRPFLLNKIA
ncbi:NACHT domain-containing protein, partial [bacterium endosymbiont of Bathymodiolus sp. 5 South]|uniref:NACHT domain-containing protein n=1 Tax=bacterium endosymbiont of Bathymodiolus sp. 5 South TaxID=1181670 RepID=UPI0015D657BE